MLARLPADADAVADGSAGWLSDSARGLGALAARCVAEVGMSRPQLPEVGQGEAVEGVKGSGGELDK